MALFVKKIQKKFNKRQQGQSTSVEKVKGKPFEKINFVKKSSNKSGQKQCFECHGFEHIAINCPTKKTTREAGF